MIASMATVPGRGQAMKAASRSLSDQCPTNVWAGEINGRTDDARKFYVDFSGLCHANDDSGVLPPVHILTCDDDLIYPPDYAVYMAKMCDHYGCPVSLMGRRILRPLSSYYRDKGGYIKHDWRTADGKAVQVDIPGTGVFCYRTDQIRFTWDDFPLLNAADINVGIACRKRGVKIMRVPPPRRDWIEYLPVPDTIYDRHVNDDGPQTEMVNNEDWK